MADADDTRPRGRSQSFLERAAIEAAAAMKNEYVDSQLVDEWCDDDGTLQAALECSPRHAKAWYRYGFLMHRHAALPPVRGITLHTARCKVPSHSHAPPIHGYPVMRAS